MTISRAHFILFVRDQAASTAFYRSVLLREPRLEVPGMTEFPLPADSVLGLMPAAGVVRLLGDALTETPESKGPRAELYLLVDDPEAYLARARAAGARLLSAPTRRDWGHVAGYCEDLDGYVLAFARAHDEL